jgi:AAA domain
MSLVRYDDALPKFAALVRVQLGEDALAQHLFLRDVEGRLTLVLRGPAIPGQQLQPLRELAAQALSPYVTSAAGSVATPDELFDVSLAMPDAGIVELVSHPDFEGAVRVVERRAMGRDWLTPPYADVPALAGRIVVFASHKGGVGRSTALAVAAADFAAKGERVLIVDLDLESPGAGDVLLPERDLPEFGALDFFVENGLGPLDDAFYRSLVGTSPLSSNGVIHVVPATGRTSREYPANVLGKLSRAYLEDPDASGSTVPLLIQTRALLERLVAREHYDAVFVDARAGLNEATASALLGLGADILLFGVDTPQTFHGYRYLLAHLRRFSPAVPDDDDFRLRLRMVHARASASPVAQAAFRDRAYELFADHVYDETGAGEIDAFNFDTDDEAAPHFAWPILDDSSFMDFDPVARPDLLSEPVYARTFGIFLQKLRARVRGEA